MAELQGTVVTSPLVPGGDSSNTYPTHDAIYGKGGWRSVKTIAERDAITEKRKTTGMIVWVEEDKKEYTWLDGKWQIWSPASVYVPTKLSELTNDADYVQDADYDAFRGAWDSKNTGSGLITADGNGKISDSNLKVASTTTNGIITSGTYQMISEIELAVFPISFKSFSAGTQTIEIGSSATPTISWSIQRKGTEVNPTAATVDGGTAGVASTKKSFTAPAPITSNKTYRVVVSYNTQTITRDAAYSFVNRKWWGTSTKEELTAADIIALPGTALNNSRAMGLTTFDCTGGKYPYYVIPTSIAAGLKVYVGLETTDLVIKTIDVVKANGAKVSYTTIRLGEKQNGQINIEYK